MNVAMNCFSYSCWDQIPTWLWVHFKSTLFFFTIFIVGRLIWAVYKCCLGRPYRSLIQFDEQGGTLSQCRLRLYIDVFDLGIA